MPRAAVAFVVALLALAALATASTTTPAGNPHIDLTVTAPSYNNTDVAEKIAAWLAFNTPLSKYGDAINYTAIEFYDESNVGTDYSFNFTVRTVGINNVEQYYALSSLRDALSTNSVLGSTAAYTTVLAHLHENPPTSIQYDVDPMSIVYQYQTSPTYRIRLSAAPRIGKNVTFHISPVAGTVQFNTSRVVIPWPSMLGYFHARAGAVVTTSGVNFDAISGSDTPYSKYTAGTSVSTEVMTVRELETIAVTPVASNQRLYSGRTSPEFRLTVPQHRDTSFRLVVSVQISPSSGLTASPENVTITAPNTPVAFTVSGTPGVYTISYLVGHVYNDAGGNIVGASNPDFQQITTNSQITVLPTMNASSSSIPDAYLVNPVSSTDYGGAYSQEIPFHIEEDPVTNTFLTVTPSAASSTGTIEFSPSSLTFFPGGARTFTIRYRAHATGVQTIQYALSGTAAGDYFLPRPTRRWIVHGRNPRCLRNTASDPCFAAPGCVWNEARSVCSNGTLPIGIDSIPLLYDNEESIPLNFTLPTPVRTTLTVTFNAASRLTFNPPSVTLSAGMTTAQFTVTAALQTGDIGSTKQDFQLKLTGGSANMYDEQLGYVFARPKVRCTVTAPSTAFFVRTLSNFFTISCDTSPETEVIFTPTSTMGSIVFVAENPDPRGANALYFAPGQTTARFYANSTTDEQGTVTLTMGISGVNAPRYDPIETAQFRVIESGVVNVPPQFHMTAYETSQELHLDLSVPPPLPLNVTIRPVNNDSSPADVNITVNPPVLTFNQTSRGIFTVSARGIGWFYLTFSIAGANVPNYIDPSAKRLRFEVKDPLSGRAFDARLRPGFLGHRKQCRVSVGRQSRGFRGQAPVDRATEFCQQHPNVQVLANETFNCSMLATEERCRDALGTLGHACAWVNSSCYFVQSMQGNILSFAYGSGFTVFLSNAGEVWTIGNTRYGQLGHYNASGVDKVPLPESIAVIAAGNNHVMALSYMGRVYTWGANQNGQLGTNARTMHEVTPSVVAFPSGENITCISSGTLHLAALSQSGRLFMWGSNSHGQLGTRAQYRGFATGPIPLGRDVFNGDAIVAVTLGEYHTMAATDNNAYTWGSNTMGQLGRPAYDDWEPKVPVHWVRDKWTSAPSYASYLLGRDC
uniref:RCC1-like domain-containing protein n=1 Tax=Neobodo designis TaxID=312471 RepID=A0A7S1L6J1_NEODS|mmetsp:Transcript_15789/g.48965  ORF Transcript_15789/g.48965 Transcript_15789/m.48965 type:complete len:1142 (+) Transcript_15789:188-3613(+)|eukprot:CAMPEP_0174832120 /NCGR_PEP_ID=MMETSP1114-20130205/3500_1 /TAXON_ID=312471 /ORGANISM="Neobodo designis, Strain CCAP 1951/1" /LENGTH=1141 /DNA_ID=CAMNT_0016065975 /DNA_START=188 /DNA_END=3613 /DNA_ORIENTATION=-